MKIYIPNLQDNLNKLGGGFTFLKNLHKGLNGKVEFVDNWNKCDIVFIFGITTIDKTEVHNAINAGKKLVLRIDNIPRKSRNKRQSPVERLTEFGNKADAVIYQSKWCKEYAGFFIDNTNEIIINNGVDTHIFNPNQRNTDSHSNTYLYINYNDNPNKRFDEALYWFDMEWRKNNDLKLLIAGQVPKIYIEHPEYNWDLTGNGKVEYQGILTTPESIAKLMKRCDYILYPSFAEAYPNTLLEAISCGVYPKYINPIGGAMEVFNNCNVPIRLNDEEVNIKVKTIEEMSNKYLEIFNKIINN